METKSHLSFKYAVGTILYQSIFFGLLYVVNISPNRSTQIMLFLQLYIPVILLMTYVYLRMLCRAEKRRKKDDFSEGMLLVFSICSFLVGSVIFHTISILLGAPLIENIDETFAFSMLCSCLAFFPMFVVHEGRWDDFLNYFPESIYVTERLQDSVKIVTIFSIVGAWVGAFPIPLDWDRDWQTWPITCCIGSLIGHFIGLVYIVIACVFPLSNPDSNWKNKIT